MIPDIIPVVVVIVIIFIIIIIINNNTKNITIMLISSKPSSGVLHVLFSFFFVCTKIFSDVPSIQPMGKEAVHIQLIRQNWSRLNIMTAARRGQRSLPEQRNLSELCRQTYSIFIKPDTALYLKGLIRYPRLVCIDNIREPDWKSYW